MRHLQSHLPHQTGRGSFIASNRQLHPLWSSACSSSKTCRTSRERLRKGIECQSGRVLREVLSSGQRRRFDEEDDSQFYAFPRLVKHTDEGFIAATTKLYASLIPKDGVVLDLMSSWISHLPRDNHYKEVVGHGMNSNELSKNKQLTRFFVRNLNNEPDGWDFPEATFDAVACCVSVQYLQQPERVFAEIYRVLKPGGVCIIAFSNRLYSSKAIQAWRDAGNDYARIQLVKQYFLCVDGFRDPEAYREMPKPVARQGLGGLFDKARSLVQTINQDPFYAVVSFKDS